MSELLTLKDAAKRCSLCVKTLRRAIKAKHLKCLQPTGKRGKILISLEQLSAWLSLGAASLKPSPVVSSSASPRPYVSTRWDL